MSTNDVDALRAELGAVREREQTYRRAWRTVTARANAHEHEVHRLRRALRRKTRVAEIGFKWARENREQRGRYLTDSQNARTRLAALEHALDALRWQLGQERSTAQAAFAWLREARRERDEARTELDRLRALVSRLQTRRVDADEYIRELKSEGADREQS